MHCLLLVCPPTRPMPPAAPRGVSLTPSSSTPCMELHVSGTRGGGSVPVVSRDMLRGSVGARGPEPEGLHHPWDTGSVLGLLPQTGGDVLGLGVMARGHPGTRGHPRPGEGQALGKGPREAPGWRRTAPCRGRSGDIAVRLREDAPRCAEHPAAKEHPWPGLRRGRAAHLPRGPPRPLHPPGARYSHLQQASRPPAALMAPPEPGPARPGTAPPERLRAERAAPEPYHAADGRGSGANHGGGGRGWARPPRFRAAPHAGGPPSPAGGGSALSVRPASRAPRGDGRCRPLPRSRVPSWGELLASAGPPASSAGPS